MEQEQGIGRPEGLGGASAGPERPGYRRVPVEAIRAFSQTVFERHGFDAEAAAQITDVLVCADLFGIESHGVSRLIKYHRLIRSGAVDVAARPERVFESPLSTVIDAHGAIGQVAAVAAMDDAIARAQAHGVGIAVVRHGNHYGIARYYALRAARAGLIGMSMTNTVAIQVPTFAAEALLGSNPIAFAAPAGTGRDPFLFDAATTVVPRGKIEVYRKRGEALPDGWAVSRTGAPDADAADVLDAIAAHAGGGLLPLGGYGELHGGHKGYGLATIVEILTGVAAAGALSADKTDRADTSQCFWAIDPVLFGDAAGFQNRVAQLMDRLHAARRADDARPVLVAGERELASARAMERAGVPVNDATARELASIGEELGVRVPGALRVRGGIGAQPRP